MEIMRSVVPGGSDSVPEAAGPQRRPKAPTLPGLPISERESAIWIFM